MSHELHYTSSPRGLKPGAKGYCTVASTAHMPGPLAERLEGLSGYKQIFPANSPDAARNPVVVSHLRIRLGGQDLSVISRVASAGVDYTDRSNKYAHHVALNADERPAGGPAWVAAQDGFLETHWEGDPRILPSGRKPPQGDTRPGVARTWEHLTGDAGWAGVLAEAFLENPNRVVYLIGELGLDLLPLFVESIALLSPSRRWDVTFSTYATSLPQGIPCSWRGVLRDTIEATQARRSPEALVLDLTQPMGAAQGGALVEQARTGRAPDPPAIPHLPPPDPMIPLEPAPPPRRSRRAVAPPLAAPIDRRDSRPIAADGIHDGLDEEYAVPTRPIPRRRRTASGSTMSRGGLALAACLIFLIGVSTGWVLKQSRPASPVEVAEKTAENRPTDQDIKPKVTEPAAQTTTVTVKTSQDQLKKREANSDPKASEPADSSPSNLTETKKLAANGADVSGTGEQPESPQTVASAERKKQSPPKADPPGEAIPIPTEYLFHLQPTTASAAISIKESSDTIDKTFPNLIEKIELLGGDDPDIKTDLAVEPQQTEHSIEVYKTSRQDEIPQHLGTFHWQNSRLTFQSKSDGGGTIKSFQALRECVLKVTFQAAPPGYFVFKMPWEVEGNLSLKPDRDPSKPIGRSRIRADEKDASKTNWGAAGTVRKLGLWLDTSKSEPARGVAEHNGSGSVIWNLKSSPDSNSLSGDILNFHAILSISEPKLDRPPLLSTRISPDYLDRWDKCTKRIQNCIELADLLKQNPLLGIPKSDEDLKVLTRWIDLLQKNTNIDIVTAQAVDELGKIGLNAHSEREFLRTAAVHYSLCVKVGDQLFRVSEERHKEQAPETAPAATAPRFPQ